MSGCEKRLVRLRHRLKGLRILIGCPIEAALGSSETADLYRVRKNEVAAYARCPPLPPWTLWARETRREVVMVGLPKPGDIQKMLDGFHNELRAIRTLLEQLLELERERIERDQAA